LVVHWLSPDLIQSFSSTDGSGIQAWLLPAGHAISSRVVTWKLRQVPGVGSKFTSARASIGHSAANVSAMPALRNSRLCMVVFPI
jgi:hypothetical protein